jgi:Flp pilus assembly protein TadD
LHQEAVFIEDSNGNPISFKAKNESKGEKLLLTGSFLANGTIKIEKELNGNISEEIVSPTQKLLFPKSINDLFKGNNNKFEYSTIDTSTGFIITKINAEKQTDDSNKYKVMCDLLPGIISYEWHDNSGKLLKSTTDKLNMEMVAENDVKKDFPNNLNLDILKSSLIPSNELFEQTDNLKQVNYKIESNDDNFKIVLPEDERQSVIQKVGNSLFLKIKDEEVSDNSLLPVNKIDIYLKSGEIISFDETMKNTSSEIIAGENNAYKAAKKLEKWVNSYITNKNYSTPFANATEVFKTREGDCTEHSILLAAMLRAAGIPSKVATGLFYTNNPESSFAYHMWTKAYIGSRWVNLDATLKENTFSPLHIELSESALNNSEDKLNLVVPIISDLSNLKITVLNYYKKANTMNIDLSAGLAPNSTENIDLSNSSDSAVKNIDISSKSSLIVSEVDLSNTDVDKHVDQAYLAIAKGDVDTAIDEFEEASRSLSFNDDFASLQLAQKMASNGFFILAEKQFRNINENEIWKNQIINIKSAYFPLSWADKKKESLYVIATSKFNLSSNSKESLINYLEKQKDVSNDDYFCFLLGESYLNLKDYKTAQKYLDKAVKLNQLNQRYRLAMAPCMLNLNQSVQAKNELLYLANSVTDEKLNNIVMAKLFSAKSKSAKENTSDFLYYQAKEEALNGNYKEASDILKRLAAKFPKYSKAYSLNGDISYKLNEFDNAFLNYNKSIKFDNKNEKAYIGLGNLNLLNNKKQDAEKMYLQSLKINPKNIEALEHLAGLAVKNGKTDLALNYNQEILKYSPLNFKANLEIGLIKVSLNESELASPYLKKALSINPYLSDCWLELAKIEVKKRNYFIARSYLKNTGALDSKNAQYFYYMGIIDNANGDVNSARDNFERATMLKPNYTEAIEQLEKLN